MKAKEIYKYTDTVWLLQDVVEIKPCGSNKHYWQGKLPIKENSMVDVPLENLSKYTKYKVATICPYCNKVKNLKWSDIMKTNSTSCWNCPSRKEPYETIMEYPELPIVDMVDVLSGSLVQGFQYSEKIFTVSEFTIINVIGSSVKRYKKLGYLFVKRSDSIIVHISHLPKQSHVRVDVICPSCGQVRSAVWKAVVTLTESTYCHSCGNNGFEAKGYFDGRSNPQILSPKEDWYGEKRFGRKKLLVRCKDCGTKFNYTISSISSNNNEIKCRQCGVGRVKIGSSRGQHIESVVAENKYNSNFKCVVCASNVALHSHHLYNYRDYREYEATLENLICICQPCHIKFHRWNGGNKKLATPNDFKYYLTSLNWSDTDIRDLWLKYNLLD